MPPSWTVEFTASARREFKSLGAREKASAGECILELADDPFPPGAIPLRSYKNLYRVRFYHGHYRLIYAVYEKQQKVIVTRVRPRGTAYIGMRDEI
jgi:mRNA-degrading endonuclease RelE of RelBE toxin-antitoxin system